MATSKFEPASDVECGSTHGLFGCGFCQSLFVSVGTFTAFREFSRIVIGEAWWFVTVDQSRESVLTIGDINIFFTEHFIAKSYIIRWNRYPSDLSREFLLKTSQFEHFFARYFADN